MLQFECCTYVVCITKESEEPVYRDCARCVDLQSIDWSPDVIIRRREHPATIFQQPLPSNIDQTRCLYAVQLKSWYDEQYNDWAKRYLRERVYNSKGIDRGAVYMYKNLFESPRTTSTTHKKLAPKNALMDEEYLVTECKRFVGFNLHA